MNKILIPTFILFLSSSLLAHKPVLNESSDYPIDAPYEVEEPEISKAIFSTLDGAPSLLQNYFRKGFLTFMYQF